MHCICIGVKVMRCPYCNDVETTGEPWIPDGDEEVDHWWCANCEGHWLASPWGKILEIYEDER